MKQRRDQRQLIDGGGQRLAGKPDTAGQQNQIEQGGDAEQGPTDGPEPAHPGRGPWTAADRDDGHRQRNQVAGKINRVDQIPQEVDFLASGGKKGDAEQEQVSKQKGEYQPEGEGNLEIQMLVVVARVVQHGLVSGSLSGGAGCLGNQRETTV